MTTKLHHLGAFELARRIARGETTSLSLVDLCLDRIARLDGAINAVVLKRVEAARDAARRADEACAKGLAGGPLHGVPITIKECFDWVGTPSTFGYPERAQHAAKANATVVDRLIGAGAIIVGKTNVPKDLSDWQSVNALYGRTRNPWNIARSPGGSSGGSAAAIAAAFSALELGSDVGGSIRIPAHFCGVYGHKPTYGIVPVSGHAMDPGEPPADINVVGPLARTAEDLERALRIIAGPESAEARAWSLRLPDPWRQRLADFRVAVITGDAEFPVDTAVQAAARSVAGTLRRSGAHVTLDPALPLASREYYELYVALLRGSTSARRTQEEIAAFEREALTLDPADRAYRALMLRGLSQSHRGWLARNDQRHRLRAAWERFFADHDVLVAPVSPTAAFPHIGNIPKHEQRLLVSGRERPISDTYFWLGIAGVAYLPATVVPAGLSEEGLPVGLQLIGPAYGDLTTIALARHLEREHRAFTPPPALE